MLRRCILELSKRRSLRQVPTLTQRPYLLSRKQFSASSRQNASGKSSSHYNPSTAYQKPLAPPEPPVSSGGGGGNMVKLVVGGVLISGVVAATAYQILYLNPPNTTNKSLQVDTSDKSSKDVGGLGEKAIVNDQEPSVSKDDTVNVEKDADGSHVSDHNKVDGEGQVQDEAVSSQQNELPSFAQAGASSDDQASHSERLSEETFDKKEGFSNAQSSIDQNEVAKETSSLQETKEVPEETETKTPSTHNLTTQESPEDSLVNGAASSNSLVDFYHLGEKNEESNAIAQDGKANGSIPHSNANEDPVSTSEELKDGKTSKDGNLVLDFLEAIHAAEKRQAKLDAHILAEEKRTLKEKYEKDLKDARARELMYAEAAAMLDKEITEERTKAAAALRTLQEKGEENLKMELEHKGNETEMQLKKVKELAKAELAAAIASEKASQIEKMAEANLNIDALCMAFYARSEEARQNHSVHKLALGALALEDAISKGLPIQTEIKALHTYLEGIDKDSLLNLVLSSLPEETLEHGTETILQLNQKFDALKTPLRHYSLIPPGGGGILSHTVAHIASGIKLKESDTSGDGIESIINRVQNFLAQGELAEAANALEEGVRGSQAEEVVGEWVKQARNRAITEQALSLLQSYATSINVA